MVLGIALVTFAGIIVSFLFFSFLFLTRCQSPHIARSRAQRVYDRASSH